MKMTYYGYHDVSATYWDVTVLIVDSAEKKILENQKTGLLGRMALRASPF
jgi:hypothetical protein